MTSRNRKSLFGTMTAVASATALVVWIGVGSASPVLTHGNATPGISVASLGSAVSLGALGTGLPPVAANDSYSTLVGQSLTVNAPGVLANDSDPENDPITAQLGAGPVNGSLTLLSMGAFIYTPLAGFTGDDSFRYTASDGLNTSQMATVTITVGGSTTTTTAAASTTTAAASTTTAAASTTTAAATTTTAAATTTLLAVIDGGALYTGSCAGCHGATGGGGFGPALTGLSNATFISITASGVAGTAMPAFGTSMTAAEIQAMADFILGTTTTTTTAAPTTTTTAAPTTTTTATTTTAAPTTTAPTTTAPTTTAPTTTAPTTTAPPSNSAATYGTFCASCHGVDGSGTAAGPSISGARTDEIMTIVRFGEGSMPAYPAAVISNSALVDLADYVSGSGAPSSSKGDKDNKGKVDKDNKSKSKSDKANKSKSDKDNKRKSDKDNKRKSGEENSKRRR